MKKAESDFKKKSLIAQRKLNMDELCQYKRELRKSKIEQDKKFHGIKLRKLSHPIVNAIIEGRRLILGQSLTIDTKTTPREMKEINKKEKRSIIFAVTHMGKYDIEIVDEAIKVPYYLLSDDEEYMYRTVDGFITFINGVIYVDNDFPEDRKIAKKTIDKLLMSGANIMWYVEGIWNLNPNLLTLPCKIGIIDSAIRTNSVIIPIALDQRNEKDFYVNIGEPIYPETFAVSDLDDKEGKIEEANNLRDVLSTLKYEIYEKFPIESRKDIPDGYWEKFVSDRLSEWPFFKEGVFEQRTFKPKNIVDSSEVFDSIINKIRSNWDYYEVKDGKILKKKK